MSTGNPNRRFALMGAAVCAISFVVGGGAVSAARSYMPRHAEAAGHFESPTSRGPSSAGTVTSRQLEIANLLKDHYYREVDVRVLAHIPLKLPEVLDDPYTQYLAPAQLAEFDRGDTGTHTGVGVHAKPVDHDVVFDGVTAGGPLLRLDCESAMSLSVPTVGLCAT